jgi:hypothetical protein
MLLIIDVLKIDFFVVDVIELDVLGAHHFFSFPTLSLLLSFLRVFSLFLSFSLMFRLNSLSFLSVLQIILITKVCWITFLIGCLIYLSKSQNFHLKKPLLYLKWLNWSNFVSIQELFGLWAVEGGGLGAVEGGPVVVGGEVIFTNLVLT